MQFFPERTVFLKIGNFTIQWYAILILTGAVLVYTFVSKRTKKAGYPSELADDLFIGVMVSGVIGARIWYVLFSSELSIYLADPISIIQVWNGGLAIQGGLITGSLFTLLYCKKHHYEFFHIADYVAPSVLIAQAFGRWGNFVNQECYGPVVSESYYDGILSFIKDGMYILHEYRMPMFFYESTLCILGFLLIELNLNLNKNKKRGQGLFGYLLWYGAIRFWIESFRTDSLYIGPFRIAQVISIIFMIVGTLGFIGVFNKLIYKKPLIIFDLDGTLCDTEELIFQSFKHVFEIYKPDYQLTKQDRINFLGPTLKESFEKYIPEVDNETLCEEYRKHNWELHEKYIKPIEGVPKLLENLYNEGYPLTIASSKKKDTCILGLKCCGLDKYFDLEKIVGCEDVAKFKPDPECVIKAYKNMGYSMSSCIYVGDSHTDILAGNAAGVYTIGYVANEEKIASLVEAKANKVIDHMADIKEIVKEKHAWTHNMM